jgi:hypothetical protein
VSRDQHFSPRHLSLGIDITQSKNPLINLPINQPHFPESRPIRAVTADLLKLFRWLLLGIRTLCLILLLAWGTLAIYYSNLPWAWARLAAAVVFLTFGVWALWYRGTPRTIAVFAALFLGVLVWFISIKPSHDRPWRPEVAVMPRAYIDGDRVRITGVRNFEYRSRTDFTVRYEEREVYLSHLMSLDFYLSY